MKKNKNKKNKSKIFSSDKIQRLKAETEIGDLVFALGIPVKVKGNAKFIRCPRPDHDDRHESCYFKDGGNFLYCNSCGNVINPVDLIMYNTGMSFRDALMYLWDVNGRPAWFTEEEDTQAQRRVFRLTKTESDLIGFKMPNRILVASSFSDVKIKNLKKNSQLISDGGMNYIEATPVHCNANDFASNRDLAKMAIRKAKDKKDVYRQMWLHTRDDFPEMASVCIEMMVQCDSVIKKISKFT